MTREESQTSRETRRNFREPKRRNACNMYNKRTNFTIRRSREWRKSRNDFVIKEALLKELVR